MSLRLCVYVKEFPHLSSVVHYQSTRQLSKYTLLLHQLQLLTLQRRLMLDVGQQTIRLLQQMDPNDRSVNPLKRSGIRWSHFEGLHLAIQVYERQSARMSKIKNVG